MNLLISKLSGLRVLCGETINNCLPIHKIFAQATESNEDEEGQRTQQEDPFAGTSMERQNKQVGEEEEEEERKHFTDASTNNTASSHFRNEYEMNQNSIGEKDEYDTPFIANNQMTMQSQSVFDAPVNVPQTKPKTQKKPMLGMLDEDKIQKVEKNDPADDVDYFSQMNMGMQAASNTVKPAPKVTKKQPKTKTQEVKPDDLFQDDQKVESKFNMNNDAVEETEGAGWGDNDDIDL